MKKATFYILLATSILLACDDNDRNLSAEPKNEMDAARNFIRAALDGDYEKAKTMLLPDSMNLQVIETYQRSYQKSMSKDEKEQYRSATIRIHDSNTINDSTKIVVYSNSYMNQKDSLKVIKINGKWLIDFAFVYKNRLDSLQ